MENSKQESKIQSVNIPLFKGVLGCYGMLLDNIKSFFLLGTVFSLILSLLYFITGQDILCNNNTYRAEHYCTNSGILYATIHIISFFILCVYARCWVQFVSEKKQFDWRLLLPQKTDIKLLGVIIIFMATLSFALMSGYLLIVRVPNPNWKIEISYFAIVSLGFMVPLLALRFLSCLAFVAEDKKMPKFSVLWAKSSGNMFVLILGAIFLMFVAIFLLSNITQNIIFGSNVDSYITAIGGEYIFNLVTTLVWALIMNYSIIQKQVLFAGDSDE